MATGTVLNPIFETPLRGYSSDNDEAVARG
jgi:hypothetical protein